MNSAKSIGARRLDLVANLYWLNSIKDPRRKNGETSGGVRLSSDDILARRNKLDEYLTNDELKTDFNKLIFKIASEYLDTYLEFVITDGLKVLKINDGVQMGKAGLI